MPVPSYEQFIEPLLQFLGDKVEPVPARDAHEAAANMLGLSAEQRLEALTGGQPVYKNRAGWAHDRLKRSGYSHSPKRGFWQLTAEGRKYFQATTFPLPVDEVRRIQADSIDVRLRPAPGGAPLTALLPMSAGPVLDQIQSPDDRLDQATREIRSSVMADVLEMLKNVSPTYFEHIVLDVLHGIGYGASRSDIQRVGGTGDGGIDGIISLDRLGLERVYVQAKRWQSVVGSPEIQGFFGALAGRRATKGVFITTSSFSAQAINYAASVEKIVLVDGAKLAELMVDHGIGVTLRQVKIPRMDSDYFDESGS